MSSYEAWLAAMPRDGVRQRIAQLEQEIAVLRVLERSAPAVATGPARDQAPTPARTAKRKGSRAMSPARLAIRDYVGQQGPDGAAPSEAAAALALSPNAAQTAMWRMEKVGQLAKAGPRRYKLPPESSTEEPADAAPSGSEGEAMEP